MLHPAVAMHPKAERTIFYFFLKKSYASYFSWRYHFHQMSLEKPSVPWSILSEGEKANWSHSSPDLVQVIKLLNGFDEFRVVLSK